MNIKRFYLTRGYADMHRDRQALLCSAEQETPDHRHVKIAKTVSKNTQTGKYTGDEI